MKRILLSLVGLIAFSALADEPFRYQITEGLNLNAFLRDGPVAAHTLLRSGHEPRILVAFPAGNSGVGLWFEPVDGAPQWLLDQAPSPQSVQSLNGESFTASIRTPELVPKQAVLSSVRFLRDYQAGAPVPGEILTAPARQGNVLTWSRDRLDGAPGYRLSLEVKDGTLDPSGHIQAGPDGIIRLSVIALSGDPPLHPLSGAELLKDGGATAPALTFLSYREKFLAGSWRFDTYFGRDTLMSMRLLLPALAPEAAEAGLGSVLDRLNDAGEVAHEEGIGEFALVDHKSAAPVFDYGMIDGNYMLGPVAVAYLLDDAEGRRRAAAFLARDGHGTALVRNLAYVAATTAPFADKPGWQRLIRFKPGRLTGQWRDSEEGNGRGVYAYDVNAVFAPAALRATARLLASGLLDPYLDDGHRTLLMKADKAAAVWRDRAPGLFDMDEPARIAKPAIRDYASTLGISADAALASVTGDLRFHALALDAAGNKVPVLHSDEGFALMFADPAPADLDRAVQDMMRPFPAGLMTEAGLLVANPVFADATLQARFSRSAYHGTVIWSWQQALLAAGLERQLRRADLPPKVRETLLSAQKSLWRAIDATGALRSSELWTWKPEQDRIVAAPFGANANDADESNAAQLWSTVYLAVRPPPR